MMAKSGERIKSLDGLRAVSIGLVVISHLIGIKGFFIPEQAGRVFELGELGVRVFFVISGFLITSILLAELEYSGSLDLRRFYFRRTLRIFPPYYLFILVVFLAQIAGLISLNSGDLMHALTYTSNYHLHRSWIVGHTWSLAVEEQFYLLWPLTVLLCGKKRALTVAVAFVLLAPLIRIAVWQLMPDYRDGMGQTFETAGDAIAIGCVLAMVRARLHTIPAYSRFIGSRLAIIAPLIVLLGNGLHNHPTIHYLAGYTLMNVGIALLIDRCVTCTEGRVGSILNSAPMITVGLMSYSIYLWQQVFLDRYSLSPLCAFPLNIILAGAAAAGSYYLCEQPSFRVRRWLEKRLFQKRMIVPAELRITPQTVSAAEAAATLSE